MIAGSTVDDEDEVLNPWCNHGRWHFDEMVVVIAGRRFWLRRGVDDEGEFFDLLVHSPRAAPVLAPQPSA